MKYLKRVWHYLLADPFTWLFYYFFQPANFRREFETKDFAERIIPMLRLAFPIFLVSYSLSYFSNWWATLLGTIGGIVWGIVGGIRWGIIGGISLSVGLGLGLGHDIFNLAGFGSGFGVGMGLIGDILGDPTRRVLGSIKARALKILTETLEIFTETLEKILNEVASWISVGFSWIATWILMGFFGGFVEVFGAYYKVGTFIVGGVRSVTGGIALSTVVGILIGFLIVDIRKATAGNTSENILKRTIRGIMRVVVWSIVWGIVGGCVGSIIGAISWKLLRDDPRIIALAIEWAGSNNSNGDPNVALGITWGGITGGMIGIVLGIVKSLIMHPTHRVGKKFKIGKKFKKGIDKPLGMGIEESIALGIGWGIVVTLVSVVISDPLSSIGNGFNAIFLFILYYLVGYYRLPTYLISSISTFRMNYDSEKNPSQVFKYLHRSALYWDESTKLPLPFLEDVLHIAVEQNKDQVLEEISFIKTERPSQIQAAQVSLIEIIIQNLEKRKTLRNIAEASQQLATFREQGKGVLDSKWEAQLTRLYSTSLDATRYLTSLRWQARYEALTGIIANLEKIIDTIKEDSAKKGSAKKDSENSPSLEEKLKERLSVKINTWLNIVQGELDKLNQEREKTDQINNPYIVGPVLDQLGTSLFVGRGDLASQLEQALRRGSQRPTFSLNGERRMGKSSTLKQLPYLLDRHYFLPIFYDLQAPGMTSSIVAFLSTVADRIHDVVSNEIQLEVLDKKALQEASRKSEAEVYFVFDEWLKNVEHLLEQKDWTLLLSFDEFEHLEKVAQAKYLDMHLLLNWFRSIIQNRPRLALLFSGGRSISEMSTELGINWASYFVNVQTLRVSFLLETEVLQLITHPIPDYPIEQIYGEGVVDEIIRVTGCHPFLVQAVCSALIDNLNADKREQATVRDVGIAVNQLLENWEAYFQDLWDRTDKNQRLCLFTIGNLGKGDLQKIAQQSGLDERIVRRTLEILRKRDLVVQENETYRIAAPIFSKWVDYHY